ncbi:hypothetical protein GAQ93_14400 [Bacteroides uniformis]|nr:hypothetical protein GAQ93_14400 [Bacteroides uniformis]
MKYLLYNEYLILLNTSLKKQGAKIAKHVGICSIYIKKTTYTYFKKNYVVNFSDIYITFASWKTCIATTLA